MLHEANEDVQALWAFVNGEAYGPDCRSLPADFCPPEQIPAAPAREEISEEASRNASRDARLFYDQTPKPALALFAPAAGMNESAPRKTLAVHVRRGDVTADGRWDTRWVPTAAVAQCIDSAVQVMGCAAAVDVHVFSDGGPADVAELRQLRLRGGAVLTPAFHLQTDLRLTFHHFVSADGFLMGSSALSHSAQKLRSALSSNENATFSCTARGELVQRGLPLSIENTTSSCDERGELVLRGLT